MFSSSLRVRRFESSLLLAAGAVVLSSTLARATEPFTLIALPDTQYYTKTDARMETYFKGQTNWIMNNVAAENIKFVLHLGDVQNDGNPYYARTDNIYEPDFTRPTGLVPDDAQFRRADEALDILDAHNVPYSIAPGNHDYIDNTIKDEPIYYLKWFGPDRYQNMSTFGGYSPASSTFKWAGMNTYHVFEAGGYQFLNLALQFAPDTNDLTWARKVINDHPGLPTIVTTHAMLNTVTYQSGRKNIFDQLVKLNPQVIMTMNGHIDGTNRITETNIAGQTVHEMLVDYQATDFSPYVDGGGYLRKVQFDLDNNVVHVKSYSPVIGNYLTDNGNQFDLPLNLRDRFGIAPTQPAVTIARGFQHGVNNYLGTHDTHLESGVSSSNGTSTGVWVDGDGSSASGLQPRQALIRFDDLFSAGNIPDGATIASAKLTLHTSTTTDSHSNSTMEVYRMLKTWSEGSTYSGFGSGLTADGVEAILADNADFIPSINGGVISFDVTESLFAWLSPNNASINSPAL